VAYLHLRDLDEIKDHVSSLRNALPPLPNQRADQVHFKGPFISLANIKKHFFSPYPDSSDHLLSFTKEPEGPCCPANQGLNPYDLYGNKSTSTTTSSTSSTEATPESTFSAPASDFSENTIIKMVSSGRSRGWHEEFPEPPLLSKTMTPEAFDDMVPVHQTSGTLGAVALTLAIAATAMGLLNRAQIET
jgi:hypothetical protein